ncbi:MAG: BMC domain-containing protein [Clostridiales bacterium]|nr:BMC domain-containing protein [Clostridiales bacterium]
MKSLGFIEIPGVIPAIDAIDIMCKTADVEFVTWERKMGGRLVTVIVQGEVAAVTEAVEAAASRAMKPCVHAVIPNPHEETIKMVHLSAKKFGGEALG